MPRMFKVIIGVIIAFTVIGIVVWIAIGATIVHFVSKA